MMRDDTNEKMIEIFQLNTFRNFRASPTTGGLALNFEFYSKV